MASGLTYSHKDSFVVEGKLALPYRYFAGRLGSKFLVALRDEKKILGIKSGNKVVVPPRSANERDLTEECTEWVTLPGTGVVTGFTVVRYEEPHQPVKPPYILALIRLDGADNSFAHVVKGISPEEMRVGLRVRAFFAEKTTSTIMDLDHFEPEEKPESGEKSVSKEKPMAAGKPGYQQGYSYDELQLGMSASFSKTITETDVYLFAGISGDFNPMHVNEEFAKTTPFGTRIAHGALPQSLIAPVLGMKLPGLGTVALEVSIRFKAPTFPGDTITAKATVAEKREDRKWVLMECEWTNQNGELVATGSALVIPPPKT